MIRLTFIFMLAFSCIYAAQNHVEYTKNLVSEVLSIDSSHLSAEKKQGAIITFVSNNFDCHWSAKMSLGAKWNNLTHSQQKEFADLFFKYVSMQWLGKLQFSTANDVKFTINDKSTALQNGDHNVEIKISSPDGKVYGLTLRVAKINDKFLVRDVTVDGIGLAITTRSQFTSIIEEVGVDGLLKQLNEKIVKLRSTVKINEKNLICNMPDNDK